MGELMTLQTKCPVLLFQKVIKSDGSAVFCWSAKRTGLPRKAGLPELCWRGQWRMPCTSCCCAAAELPAPQGTGLPAPHVFSAPFFGE